MAQLTQWLLLTSETLGSYPVEVDFLFTIYLLLTLYRKDETDEKENGNGSFSKEIRKGKGSKRKRLQSQKFDEFRSVSAETEQKIKKRKCKKKNSIFSSAVVSPLLMSCPIRE